MRAKLHFMLMIFCLGFFIIPKQSLFSSSTTMECCEMQNKGMENCHQDQNSQGSHSQQDHNCTASCTACGVCSLTITPALSAEVFLAPLSKKFNTNAVKTPYKTPFVSFCLKEIWQPPKIS